MPPSRIIIQNAEGSILYCGELWSAWYYLCGRDAVAGNYAEGMNGMTTLIGARYQLGAVLGQGGMATVYNAHDTLLDRDVALKVLLASAHGDPLARRRFEQEARLAASFNHANIARVYDVGVDAAYGPFFVQELVEGRSLDALLPVAAPQALTWTRELAGALAAVHAAGLVHCDVKPQNVRVTPEGRAMLLDFGIAETSGAAGGAMIYGTPQYLAPERAQGAAPTPAADVYALGILLYELLTGHVPLDGSSVAEIVRRHIDEGVPILRTALPGTAAAIETIIRRATERDPAQRYPTVGALLADVEAAERHANSATVAMMPSKPRATVSLHNTPTTVVAAPTNRQAARAVSVAPTPIQAAPLPPIQAMPRKRDSRRGFLWVGLAVLALLGGWFVLRPTTNADQPAAQPVARPTASVVVRVAPSLVGLPLDEAERLAQTNGVPLRVVEQANADAPAGQIIAQEPAADTPLAADAVVNVVVSTGVADAPAEPAPPSDDNGSNADDKGKGNDDDKGNDNGKKDK